MSFFVLCAVSTLDLLGVRLRHIWIQKLCIDTFSLCRLKSKQLFGMFVHVPHVGGDDEAKADVERQGVV